MRCNSSVDAAASGEGIEVVAISVDRGGMRQVAPFFETHALKALLNDRTAYEVVEASAPRRAGKRELTAVNAPGFAPWSA